VRKALAHVAALAAVLVAGAVLGSLFHLFDPVGRPKRIFTVPPGVTAKPDLRLEPGYYYWLKVTPAGDFEWWRRKADTP
jgi:hypothetical protein